jgi:hypothetical protein
MMDRAFHHGSSAGADVGWVIGPPLLGELDDRLADRSQRERRVATLGATEPGRVRGDHVSPNAA